MNFPQLRVRTGFSYRNAYGRAPEVIAQLKEVGATTFGIVDAGTWGHVKFEQAAKKAEMQCAFGGEIPMLDDESDWKFKPSAWVLATDTRKLYNLMTSVADQRGAYSDDLVAWDGGFRFLGGASLAPINPAAIDYVDINPSSILAARNSLRWANEFEKPIVLTSYNDYPSLAHKGFATAWEVGEAVGFRSILSVDQIRAALGNMLSPTLFDRAVENTQYVAAHLQGISLAKAPLISLDGDIDALCRAGIEYRVSKGHISEWTQVYEDRMKLELEQIKLKGFQSYFLMVSDLVRYAKQHMLVGPARGSSAGSLVCYLMEITEVDPVLHNLLFYRFIDISRSDLPDIDIDFPDTQRHMVFEYLCEKYSPRNVAKLGNINTLQAASVLAQVGKKFGIPFDETIRIKDSLIEYSSGDERYGKALADTMTNTDPGKDFSTKHPAAAKCIGDLELHPSHTGVHAAGILVCNEPISDFCSVNAEGVACLDKYDAEYLGLLKMDILGLRTLGVIQDSGVVTNEMMYGLKFDDQSVLDLINQDKMSAVFQYEGDAVRSVARAVHIDNFKKIDHLTALARPGPLSSGMGKLYIERAAGREPVRYRMAELERYLGNTFGVFLYQEQIMSVVRDIGLFDWAKTSMIRKAMSARKGEEFFNRMCDDFVAGATSQGIDEKMAREVWQEMVTFGAWGFNQSHSLSYAIVTYWTLYMKRYHPLEYAAACLRSAKDDDQVIAILRELAKEGVQYTALDPDFSDMNWKVADGRLIGGIMNAKGYGAVKALTYVQKRESGRLTEKDRENLAKASVKFADLNEAHTLFGRYYDKPRLIGVTSGDPIIGMRQCADREECLVIAKLGKKVLSDENEPIRVKKRGGKIFKGQSKFLDLMFTDDSSDSAMRFRVRPEKYEALGKPIAEGAPIGSWFLIRAWKIAEIDMFIVKNIKRITPDGV